MPFTADFADLLICDCFMANRGVYAGAKYRLRVWNYPRVYRVLVTTDDEETDLEFWKDLGVTRMYRDGIELGDPEHN